MSPYNNHNNNYKNQTPRQGRGHDFEPLDTHPIILKATEEKPLNPDLFSEIAEKTAKNIAQDKKKNNPTQLRKFYDEIVLWDEKVMQSPQKFQQYLPFIKMMNAKAAYAEGRNHVDKNFLKLISHCIKQVDNQRTLHHFKMFFEAFLGFYKSVRPK
jgi:CRISPR-associated protein Csm2